jgi:purine nucleosidase/pyrimidine-specific ribonucleoside hydrolase
MLNASARHRVRARRDHASFIGLDLLRIMTTSGGRTTLIDTDPGIDDALAILIALASPEMRVCGLTTVAGNIGIETTTRNAARLLALANRPDIPVLRGSEAPLARPPRQPLDIHGQDGVGGIPLPEPQAPPMGSSAVAWMAEQLMEHPPGMLDILALGPLTNLARLVRTHPEAARRIGRLIAMGGAIREPGNMGPRAEFNMATDPEAAAVVLEAGLPTTLIPLDVTRRVRATRAFSARLAARGTPAASAAAALIDAYFASTSGPDSRPLHDPCVMLFAIRPHLFACEALPLRVELQGADAGALVLDERQGTPVTVAMGVDAPQALELAGQRLAPA